MTGRLLNIILGLWLMAAPALWGYNRLLANNLYIVGPLVITVAVIALWEVNRGIRRINLLLGIWLIVAAFLFEAPAHWQTYLNAATGLAIALCSLLQGKIKGRYGGGWRSLFFED